MESKRKEPRAPRKTLKQTLPQHEFLQGLKGVQEGQLHKVWQDQPECPQSLKIAQGWQLWRTQILPQVLWLGAGGGQEWHILQVGARSQLK
jgi:hypothetical protein